MLDTILSRLEETDVRLLMRVWSARKQESLAAGAEAPPGLIRDMMKSDYTTTGDLGLLQLEKDMIAAGISFPAIVQDIPGAPEELKYTRTTEAAIGPTGGEFEIPGFVKLVVPRGVLQQDTTIAISTVDVAAILRDPESANWLSGYPWSLGEDACPRELLDQVLFSPAVDISLHGAQLNGPVEVQTWRPPGSEGMECILLKHHDGEGWTDITASTRHHVSQDNLSIFLSTFSRFIILFVSVPIAIVTVGVLVEALSDRTLPHLECRFKGYIKPHEHFVEFHVVCRDSSVNTNEYLTGFTECTSGDKAADINLVHSNVLHITTDVEGGHDNSKQMPMILNSKECCTKYGQNVQMLLNRRNGNRVRGEVTVKKVQVLSNQHVCQFTFIEGGNTSSDMSTSGEGASTWIVDVGESFENVVAEVSNRWDNLARKLGFNENQIKVLRTSERDDDRRCREMLHGWRNREGSEATLQLLKQALIDIGERLTAQRL